MGSVDQITTTFEQFKNPQQLSRLYQLIKKIEATDYTKDNLDQLEKDYLALIEYILSIVKLLDIINLDEDLAKIAHLVVHDLSTINQNLFLDPDTYEYFGSLENYIDLFKAFLKEFRAELKILNILFNKGPYTQLTSDLIFESFSSRQYEWPGGTKAEIVFSSPIEFTDPEEFFAVRTFILNSLGAGASFVEVKLLDKNTRNFSITDNAGQWDNDMNYLMDIYHNFSIGYEQPNGGLRNKSGGGKMAAEILGKKAAKNNHGLNTARFYIKFENNEDGTKSLIVSFNPNIEQEI